MRIAVVEDETKLAQTLKQGLTGEGYLVEVFPDGKSALEELTSRPNDYALVILDLLLPEVNGFDVCAKMRDLGFTVPILILTARDTIEDKVQALNSGADDFLTKPFVFDELVARVRALVRRSKNFRTTPASLPGLQVDMESRYVSRNGIEVPLTPTEFDLLAYLLSQGGKAVTRTEISERLWGSGTTDFSNIVDVHISNLRKKIDDGQERKLVRTVRGTGYALAT